MQNEAFKNTTLKNGFWYDKHILNESTTIPHIWEQYVKTGRIDAFNCHWQEGMENQPHVFWDSDVAKWVEAAAYILGKKEVPFLREKVEWIIDRIEENQTEEGYFNSYYLVCETEKRFADVNKHELYCLGHLIEAACAYFENCGDARFLNLMIKYVEYVYQIFYVEKSAGYLTPGHEEIELALIRLYRITKDKKHLELAMYFINTRGTEADKDENAEHGVEYYQKHKPVREQNEAVGHVVRILYLYCAVADAYKETGDAELLNSCENIFEDIVNGKMYVTGGLGQDHKGERFTQKYDLDGEHAYNETCASIAMIMFCERMFDITHSSKYTDIIEKELYNGMLSGLSLDGKRFFYTNPLEINLKNHKRNDMTAEPNLEADWLPITTRPENFICSCCPPNINRTLASVERLMFYREGANIYINQFAESDYICDNIKVSVTTQYPKNGEIEVCATNTENVFVRIPEWCDDFSISANYEMIDGYAKISEKNFTVNFKMPTVLLMSNEGVMDTSNKVAVARGPIVYCAEGLDNAAELHKLYIDCKTDFETEENSTFGVPTIKCNGFVRKTDDKLYSRLNDNFEKTEIKLIPYFGFANRGETDMRVWLSYK